MLNKNPNYRRLNQRIQSIDEMIEEVVTIHKENPDRDTALSHLKHMRTFYSNQRIVLCGEQ